jgi:poly-gamma-glutamate capsule biosynthesis protein CapA/YwtB (metallophosphatase superfamily)
MTEGEVRIVAVGDIQPNRERPETLFEAVADEFAWGNLRYCQLECTISDKGVLRTDVRNPAHRVPPRNIGALTSVGINVVSYAGNNNLDYGIEAFQDTLARLRDNAADSHGASRSRRSHWTNNNGIQRTALRAVPDVGCRRGGLALRSG